MAIYSLPRLSFHLRVIGPPSPPGINLAVFGAKICNSQNLSSECEHPEGKRSPRRNCRNSKNPVP